MGSELEDKYIRFDWAIKRLLRQKANFGVLEGLEEGMKKGIEKERLSTGRKMKSKGLDDATIADITGLTAEEISLL